MGPSKYIAIALLLAGCTTIPEPQDSIQYDSECTTQIILRNGTKFESPIDVENMVNAEEGCIRHYGHGSCLVKFIKTGDRSYYAICKRRKQIVK